MARAYRRRKPTIRRRRRLVNNPTLVRHASTQISEPATFRRGRASSALTLPRRADLRVGTASAHINNLMLAVDTVNNWRKMSGMLRTKTNVKALKQTTAQMRGEYHDRHQKLSEKGTVGPVNKGKGFDSRPNGTLITHGKSVVPKWKRKRLYEYKYDVWQTVLLSKSNRMAGSNNVLNSYRYPIQAPECRNAETLQCMIFSPWCSNFSGIHTTMFRKINSAGTDIDHSAQYLDTIQNKVDVGRHTLPGSVDAVGGSAIVYESDFAGGAITAGTARGATNLAQALIYFDQLVKGVKIDLSFMASRAFPMRISVSLVRFIKTSPALTFTADDKRQLLNNLNYRGMEYKDYKVEWNHEFTLGALKKGRSPPRYSVNKFIKCNFLQTNTFEKNNVAEAMTQANATALGQGHAVRVNEVADGDVSSQFYILIKYRKVSKPQQFEYAQVLDTSASGVPTATVTTPLVTEQSFDIPPNSGGGVPGDGTPYQSDQGNETLGSFYVHGKLQYNWGFKRECESIPSIVSSDPSNANYKKAQSLMIDPTTSFGGGGNDTNGLYTQSPNHVQLAASTANTGP